MASLYRRHRPRSFDDVVGQEHVVRTLRNAIERDEVHHAYLFVGSRGTGKTSMAKILAASLNPEDAEAIAAGTSLDVIEMDAASNRSVDDIRELRERVGFTPAAGRWKVYILDEAHMLTKEAWNAFLKTLEEPPPNTVFVLCTTEPHKVMPTIVDRCQRFDFQRASLHQVTEVLGRVAEAEGIELDDGARQMIGRAAAGSFRDALGTLDQLVSYGGPQVDLQDVLAVLGVADAELVFDATDAIARSETPRALEAVDRVDRGGRDLAQFARDLVGHLRHLLVIRTTGEIPESFSVTASDPDRLRAQAEGIDDAAIIRSIDHLSAALREVREGADPRVMLEVALLKAAGTQAGLSLRTVAERLARLEAAAAPGPEAPSGPDDPGSGSDDPGSGPDSSGPANPDPGPEASEPDPVGAERSSAPSEEAERSEALRGAWPAVVDHLDGGGDGMLAALLADARPLRVEGELAVIGFPADARFSRRKAEAGDNRAKLAAALAAVLGAPLRPTFAELEDQASASESPEPGSGGDDEEAIVRQIKSTFDALEQGVEVPLDGADIEPPPD